MDIFSRLFGRAQQREVRTASSSIVLQWAEKRMRDLRHDKRVTPDTMFVGFIYALSTFARPSSESETSEVTENPLLGNQADFANDSALFELGCYVYFRVDLWLFANRPRLRDQISGVFGRSFIDLFSQALQILDTRALAKLVDERIGKYGELARARAGVEEYHCHLFPLMLRTKGNQKPQHQDFDKDEFIPGDFMCWGFQNLHLATKLATWEADMLPAILEMIEESTDGMQPQTADKGIP